MDRWKLRMCSLCGELHVPEHLEKIELGPGRVLYYHPECLEKILKIPGAYENEDVKCAISIAKAEYSRRCEKAKLMKEAKEIYRKIFRE